MELGMVLIEPREERRNEAEMIPARPGQEDIFVEDFDRYQTLYDGIQPFRKPTLFSLRFNCNTNSIITRINKKILRNKINMDTMNILVLYLLIYTTAYTIL